MLDDLGARGVVYEHDGATWLRTTDFGDQRDRVLGEVRRRPPPTSATTSRTTATSSSAGWEHLIDIWGADHHGQVKSLQVGHGGARLPGRRARGPARPAREARCAAASRSGISKRTGNIITLADILDEVDPDVARLTFLLQGIDTTQTFDLDVVTAQSMENPVYYVQYAHARIASIGRQGRGARHRRGCRSLDVDLAPLAHERELELLRALAAYPEVVAEAADAARAAARHHVGARLRQRVPRLLPRLPGASPTTPRSPRRGCGWRRRAASASPTRSRSSACTRPTRWRALDDDERRRVDGERRGRRADRPALLPASASVDGDGRLAIAGVDLDGARRRVRHAALRVRRGRAARPLPRVPRRVRRRRGRVRGQGVPLHRDGAARRRGRARTSTSRPAASCTSRCTAGFPADAHRVPRQQQVRRRAAARARRRASGASSSTRSTSSTASRRSSPAALPAPRVLVRVTPGRRGAHPRVHRDRHRRLEVRVHGRRTATRSRRRGARGRERRAWSSPASTATSVRRSSVLDSFARAAVDRGRARRRRRARDRRDRRRAQPRRRPRRAATSPTTRRARRSREYAVVRARRRSPTRSRDARRALPRRALMVEPGRSIAAPAGLTLYTRRHDQGDRRRAHLRRGRRRDERQPAAGHLRRARTRRSFPARVDRAAAVGRHRRGQALRAGRPPRARRAPARRRRGRRRARDAGHRRVRPLDGVELQQGAAAGGGVRARRQRPGRRAARDARRPRATATCDPSDASQTGRAIDWTMDERGAGRDPRLRQRRAARSCASSTTTPT